MFSGKLRSNACFYQGHDEADPVGLLLKCIGALSECQIGYDIICCSVQQDRHIGLFGSLSLFLCTKSSLPDSRRQLADMSCQKVLLRSDTSFTET